MTDPKDIVRKQLEAAEEVPPIEGAAPAAGDDIAAPPPEGQPDNVTSLDARRKAKTKAAKAKGKGGGVEGRDFMTDRFRWYSEIAPKIEWGDDGLPQDCPVRPLGKHGEVCYYLSAGLALTAWLPKDHSRNGLTGLFGSNKPLRRYWPRFNKDGDLTGFRPEEAADALMEACHKAGVWNPEERVRGRGAWRGVHGELIWHCGDAILIGAHEQPGLKGQPVEVPERWEKPGLIDGYLYPAEKPGPRPTPASVPGGELGPAEELLNLLETWSWRRPQVDPMLMLGWNGAAMLGGALDWRPLEWVTGGRGTGKSTLQMLVKHVQGGAIVSVSDASAAGIWQKQKHSSEPVGLDELEAQEDNRRAKAVTDLARQACSGGQILRGGAEHKGAEFTVRSCFLFSSILIPPMLGQDLSRLAILELDKLKPGALFQVDLERWEEIGRQLRRRLVDAWPRLPAVLKAFRTAMIEHGKHDARGADQFGTLLACAWAMLYDDMPTAHDLVQWGKALSVAHLQALTDETSDEMALIGHLAGYYHDRDTLGRTIGETIEAACIPDPEPEQSVIVGKVPAPGEKGPQARAEEVLARFGLKVLWQAPEPGAAAAPRWLVVANRHPGLSRVFAGTHWQGKPGAAGVWRQALRRIEGADVWPNESGQGRTEYFAGVRSKVVRVPIDLFRRAAVKREEAE